jgi:1-deoxy-D-xylulose-5-phosphate synthase
MRALPVGKGQLRRRGRGIALLAFGALVPVAEEVGAELDASVVNMRFVKPIDEAMILAMAEGHDALVTLEDNALMGGAGSAVNECLAAHGVLVPVLNLGLPDHFIEHGSREQNLADAGLDRDSLLKTIRRWRTGPELRTAEGA